MQYHQTDAQFLRLVLWSWQEDPIEGDHGRERAAALVSALIIWHDPRTNFPRGGKICEASLASEERLRRVLWVQGKCLY